MPHPPALFAFEGDFQTDLRCIPMAVRHHLDLCGIKLSLKEWVKLGPEQRSAVVALLDGSDPDSAEAVRRFDAAVVAMVEARMGEPPARLPVDPAPAWADVARVPDEVAAKAAAEGVAVTPPQWAALAPLQRFALYKLSRSSHKNENFVPACREFGIPAP
ncbi:nitrate reductase associated protein [Nannocystis bainbridge]|uniref:Nitrate reductase associated protein n=1 Tax=Nannocystis bainbridge TaxID=2995303 RepID=A0ABT5E9H7_9BACT|nr:nitrate reductase associated protein [Nannocystis bainbridge]MDC0722513.1 nitrate reductase associated protein [Nannocystis bainbridge]